LLRELSEDKRSGERKRNAFSKDPATAGRLAEEKVKKWMLPAE
jgi:hypothetical protein